MRGKRISAEAAAHDGVQTSSAICPRCASLQVRVTDSRLGANKETRRRRKCDSCGSIWTTVEMTKETADALRAKAALVDQMGAVLSQFRAPS